MDAIVSANLEHAAASDTLSSTAGRAAGKAAASGTGSGPGDALGRVLATARSYAAAVDSMGRFPAETVTALRVEGFLAALVPAELGGGAQTLRQAAATCYALGKCCSSSAMVLAMHHIQVASLVRHVGDSAWHRNFLARVAEHGLLLASVTSEAGVGGSMRTSRCAVQPDEVLGSAAFVLEKHASTVSYGAYADALLVTARSGPAAEPSDQVLVVVPRDGAALERTGGWNAMGMRGTCSEAFVVRAQGSTEQVVPVPFAVIASDTMVPVSHLLWASLWAGIAADAVGRARAFLRAALRRSGGTTPPGASRLAAAVEQLQMLESWVKAGLQRFDTDGPGQSFAAAAEMNMLKTAASEICLSAVEEALLVCGFAGYGNEGPFSVSRHVRDLHSARLMINNDRIRDNTGRLLLMQAPALGID